MAIVLEMKITENNHLTLRYRHDGQTKWKTYIELKHMRLMIALNGGMLIGFLRYLPQIAWCCKSWMITKKPISPTGERRADPMIASVL